MHRDTQGCSHEQCAGAQDGCEAHRNLAAGQDIKVVEIDPADPVADLEAAMALAGKEAGARLGEHMLLSWYDRDRDFESPQHSSECHAASAVPGYVDYGINHGATLKVVIEAGRFVFFYLGLDPS